MRTTTLASSIGTDCRHCRGRRTRVDGPFACRHCPRSRIAMPLVTLWQRTACTKAIPLRPLQKAICDVFGTSPKTTKLLHARVDEWTDEFSEASTLNEPQRRRHTRVVHTNAAPNPPHHRQYRHHYEPTNPRLLHGDDDHVLSIASCRMCTSPSERKQRRTARGRSCRTTWHGSKRR